MEKRKKVCITLPEKMLKEFEKKRQETGVPISQQIELRLAGYTIRKIKL